MDERDLTGRDIEEAKNWGLTPRKYMELREQLNRKFQEADKSKTREDVTKEVYAKAKEDARKELDEARARQVPSEMQREVVTEYLAKYEVECATLAETASALADKASVGRDARPEGASGEQTKSGH